MNGLSLWWDELCRRADGGVTGALGLLLGVTVILLVGAAVARLWPRASAAQRHLVWSTACWSALLVPLFQGLLPTYDLPVLPAVTRVFPITGGRSDLPARPGALARHATVGVASRELGEASAEIAAHAPWAAVAFMVWGMGALVVLVPLIRSRRRLNRLDADTSPVVDHRTRRIFAEVAAAVGCRRRVELKEHRSAMPMVYGLLRPVIVLPRDAATWTDDRLRHVLLHETAHIARHDVLTQTAASLVAAVYWFHPLTWIMARQLQREREQACDDIVLAAGNRPEGYATDLLDLTTTPARWPAASSAALTFARSSHMRERLHAVLDTSRRRTAVSPRAALGTWSCAVSVVALAVSLVLHPRAVSMARAQQISELAKDSPVLARLKYNPVSTPEGCQGSDSPAGAGWGHDYPMSVEGLMQAFTADLKSPTDSFAVVSVTDPTLGAYPVAMLTEPGCWDPNEAEVRALRTYLEKGGFLFVDDMTMFDCSPEHCRLAIERFERWMQKVLPKNRVVRVPASDPILDQPFKVDPAKIPNFSNEPWKLMGVYQANDTTKRLMVVATYYNALAQYWRYGPNGLWPESTPQGLVYRLGLNILAYGISH